MEFRFDNIALSVNEFWEIKKLYILRFKNIFIRIVIISIILFCGVLSSWVGNDKAAFNFFFVIAILYILFYFLKNFLFSYLRFKKGLSNNFHQTLIFNKEGISTNINSSDSNFNGVDVEVKRFDLSFKWFDIMRIYESNSFYFFVYSRKLQWILPKRLFDSTEHEEHFKKFVNSNCRIYIQKI